MTFSFTFPVIPGLPIVLNPAITQDRWNRWYFSIGGGIGVPTPGLFIGDGFINPLSGERASYDQTSNFITGPSLNGNVSATGPLFVGAGGGGSSTGSGYSVEVGPTIGTPGPGGSITFQYTW
jgi:hypothetical protein